MEMRVEVKKLGEGVPPRDVRPPNPRPAPRDERGPTLETGGGGGSRAVLRGVDALVLEPLSTRLRAALVRGQSVSDTAGGQHLRCGD